MRSRTCSSVSPNTFHAYTTSGPSLGVEIASASALILALSLSICGFVTIGSLWIYDRRSVSRSRNAGVDERDLTPRLGSSLLHIAGKRLIPSFTWIHDYEARRAA